MAGSIDLASFLSENFHSVWALELLFLLKQHPETSFSEEELVAALRASDSVVRTSVEQLTTSGLVLTEAGRARYAPANAELAGLADESQQLYAARPAMVRRLVVLRGDAALTAFANAFRFRGD